MYVYVIFRGRYTVLINTWKRNSLLKQSVAHYASCSGADAIHVVWSESNPPSDGLKAYLKKTVLSKSQTTRKPNFEFHINGEDNLNNRFKPIRDLTTDSIFSVDDDVIVPCTTLDFAFTVWRSAPFTMVGFVPRMHWLDKEVCNLLKWNFMAMQYLICIRILLQRLLSLLCDNAKFCSLSNGICIHLVWRCSYQNPLSNLYAYCRQIPNI